FDEELEDLLFARGEVEVLVFHRRFAVKMLHHLAGDGAGHGGAAGDQVVEGFEELGRGVPFEQVAGGPGGQRVEDPVVVVVDGERHDLRGGMAFLEQGGACDARHARKLDVHEHDGGAAFPHAVESRFGGGPGGGEAPAGGGGEDFGESLAQGLVVFD